MNSLQSAFFAYSGVLLASLAAWLVLRCGFAVLTRRPGREIWAYLNPDGGDGIPLRAWECTVGSGKNDDILLRDDTVRGACAAFRRRDDGTWTLTELRHDGTIRVGGKIPDGAVELKNGSRIRIGKTSFRFAALAEPRREKGARHRDALVLFLLTLFDAVLALQHGVTVAEEHRFGILAAFALLSLTQWGVYFLEKKVGLRGFVPEIVAFFLTAVGFSVAASSVPESMLKESGLFLTGCALYLLLVLWLREQESTAALRWAFGVAALVFLGLTLLMSESIWGAKNWLSVAGRTIQPSEFVKIAYIYAGSAGLERLQRRSDLPLFLAFSAAVVGVLALMGDFGTALVFFSAFLCISFLRSGSLLLLMSAIALACGAVALVLTARPYVAARFSGWGHVWEDPLGAGYQQVRAMSAMASGGFFGRGAGRGWLTEVVAADTDLVFGVVTEELGLITGICCVLAVLVLTVYAVRTAASARTPALPTAAMAAVCVYMTQTALNVFGSMDLLPFTGVTFPFVSRGGSSLVACWGLLAFIKAADAPASVRVPDKKPTPTPEKPPKRTAESAKKEAAK